MHRAEKAAGELAMAGGDGAIDLELAEQPAGGSSMSYTQSEAAAARIT
jgi:hypothetical protein